ncbi:MAG: UvrD-helicase domain-containing protein [Muribaculaceae bacterium]|nr:UvrD-helicase domain-containing protein [Muribaculaceae bacterium]
MLHLKRASAGSGKTFELAKTYIRHLLTLKEEGKPRRLRSMNGLKNVPSEIMAVTFTVKATAEMKIRILEKLAALAKADEADPADYEDIDYLEDFLKEFHCGVQELADRARAALRILLLKFSDFKVQTIDAFFQSILHTFAYEASIDENFNMEIDGDYVSAVGFDAALDSISTAAEEGEDRGNRETLYWLNKMMHDLGTGNKWNVFAKKESSDTLYAQLISQAQKLEKEDFQKIRESIFDYFDNLKGSFIDVVKEVDEANLEPWLKLHAKRAEAAREVAQELEALGLDLEDLYNRTAGRVKKSLEAFDEKILDKGVNVVAGPDKRDLGFSLSAKGKKKFNALKATRSDLNDSLLNNLDSAYAAWLDANNEYAEEVERNIWQLNTWRAFRDLLPQLMVVLEIARKKREFLEDTNTLEISDTARILSRIIGKDDTPFIYERMGSRLNHYLIDEFQDTSHMQWDNLRPLLAESHSRGEDNLIIGDAKQSIYRFRNADYKLITEVVEKEFDKVVPYTSDDEPKDWARENTNYRSSPRIIKFNNFIFSRITDLTEDNVPIFSDTIKKIYDGCEQNIPKKKRDNNIGYVNIKTYPNLGDEDRKNYFKAGYASAAEPGFQQLPELIMRLKKRGYSFREIGVLVRTRDQGKVAVRVLTEHNIADPDNKITIISEENLLVSSALSVKLIINALETAVRGFVEEEEEPRGSKKELTEEQALLKQLEEEARRKRKAYDQPIDGEELRKLMHSLQSMALPSLTEAIIDKFLPPKRRDADAPFLAAFQDAVLDYSSNHTSDIGSFLKWWKRKASKLRINTPEDSEGVRIHTIHGSKGLEYGVVIIPVNDIGFKPSKNQTEWKWLDPAACIKKRNLLPPFLPIETKASLAKTAYAQIWDNYCEEVALDELNKLYVGFTRAKNELYAYLPIKSSTVATAASAVDLLLEEKEILTANGASEEVRVNVSPEGMPADSVEYEYGDPLTHAQILAARDEEPREQGELKNYIVASDRRLLRFREDNPARRNKDKTDGLEDNDPRAEGTLKHNILQMAQTPDDIDRGLLMMKVQGYVSDEEAAQWKAELLEAMQKEEHRGWFGPDVKVLNERALLYKGDEVRRPDRVVIRPDGTAVVIDYKFGREDPLNYEQVAGYMSRLLATGRFRSVEGYIWYVPKKKVVKVG